MTSPAYVEFARLLEGAAVGPSLLDELTERFAAITRGDVFLGVVLAFSTLKADLLAAEVENAALRRQLEHRRAA